MLYKFIDTSLNKWIKKSIDIANQPKYLDNLLLIYPIVLNPPRKLPPLIEEKIKDFVEKKDKVNLLKLLLKQEKFPIENPYVSIIKANETLIEKNPKVVNKIGEILLSLGVNEIIKGVKQPKKPSRQFGSAFQKWLSTLGYKLLREKEFEKSTEISILNGSDKIRKNYANKKLGCEIKGKGLDFIIKKNNKFIIGQAKFISARGGEEGSQFNEAIDFVNLDKGSAIRIAILDGIVWFIKPYLHNIMKTNKNIMSIFLLKEFVESL